METARKTIVAAVVAILISVLSLLPPIVHFVTGPLGPAIGGYLAGSRFRLTGGQAALVGLSLGLLVGIPAPLALTEFDVLPNLSSLTLWFFAIFAGIYFGVLAGMAAWFGGNSARKERHPVSGD